MKNIIFINSILLTLNKIKKKQCRNFKLKLVAILHLAFLKSFLKGDAKSYGKTKSDKF